MATIEKRETVTVARMLEILGGIKGAKIISFAWEGSDPARYKRDKGRIRKLSHYSVMVNPLYDRKKARAAGIGVEDVEVAPTPWRDHVSGPVHVHNGYQKDRKTGGVTYDSPKKGTHYVVVYPSSGSTQFILDGQPTTREGVADLLPPARPKRGGVVPNFRMVTATSMRGASITEKVGDDKVRTHYTIM